MTLLGLMDRYATFLSGHLPRQEQGDATADGGLHPLAGALVAKEAGRLAYQVVQRQADMLAEEVLRGISDLFRGNVRGLPARLSAVTREAEGTIGSGLKVVRPQEQITTVLNVRSYRRAPLSCVRCTALFGRGCVCYLTALAPAAPAWAT